MPRITRWSVPLVLVLVLGCQEQPLEPDVSLGKRPPSTGPYPTDLSFGDTTRAIAMAISARGWILGARYDQPAGTLMLSWAADALSDVDTLADPGGLIKGINGHGDVVAHAGGPVVMEADPSSGGRPYRTVRLGLPDSTYGGNTIATELNDARLVVGHSYCAGMGGLRCLVLWRPGVDADGRYTPGNPEALPRPFADGEARHWGGVNNAGLVVGSWETGGVNGTGVSHAFVWRVMQAGIGAPEELPAYPGAVEHNAYSISDQGWILGWVELASNPNSGQSQPVLWRPDADGVYRQPPMKFGVGVGSGGGHWNACGWTVGRTADGKAVAGHTSGTAVVLPGLEGSTTDEAWSIDDAGDVVGRSWIRSGKGSGSTFRPTLWRGSLFGIPACP